MSAEQLLGRLDRIPIWPYPKRFLWVVGIGFFFAFFDIITIALSLSKIEALYAVSLDTATWTITSSLIGYIVGSFVLARLSDRLGRRLALFLSIAFFSIGSICTAFSMSFMWIVFWRLITGVGIGAEISEISTYLSEMSPAACRGRYTTLAIAWGMLGFAVVPFVALALVPHFAWGWRAMFIIGGIGGVVTFFMRRHLPDSPRWLVSQNKLNAAEVMIATAEQRAAQTVTLPPVSTVAPAAVAAKYGNRILLFVAIWFIYYIGNYAWLTLAPSLLNQHGFTLSQSLTFISVASIGFVVGSLLAAYLGDRFERKWSLLVCGAVWVITLLCVGWMPQDVVILTAGFIAASTIGFMIPLMYIYTAEHFPTASRATCVAITDGLGHLGGAFCGQIVLGIAAYFTHSFAAAFTTMAASGVLTMILIASGRKMTRQRLV